MSIPTYVTLNDLPPPVTTGTTIQTFQDVWGEWWVAKNGVNGGAWRKARDVIHAVYFRSAALTFATANTVIALDTRQWDTYGLFTGSPNYGFLMPVAGWYRLMAQLNGTSTAASQYVQMYIQINSVGAPTTFNNQCCDNQTSPLTGGGIGCRTLGWFPAAGGETARLTGYMNSANAVQTGFVNTRLEVSYWGTG